MGAAVLLDVSFVERGAVVPATVIAIAVVFAGLWFVFPVLRRAWPDR